MAFYSFISWIAGIRTPIELTTDLQSADFAHLPSIQYAESEGIEPPKQLRPTVFKTASSTNRTLSICGRQENRTLTAFQRTCLANKLNEPVFDCLPFCTPNRIRTDTLQGLNLMPLPLGYRSILYTWRDSNSQPSEPKSDASANWATSANKKSLSKLIKRLKCLYDVQFNVHKASCYSIANNLMIRDYMILLCSFWAQIYTNCFEKTKADRQIFDFGLIMLPLNWKTEQLLNMTLCYKMLPCYFLSILATTFARLCFYNRFMYGVRCALNNVENLLIIKYFKIMKNLLKSWRNALYILLVAVLFSCAGKQLPKGMTESEFNLVMATYKKAWIDGANANTKCSNNGIEFGEKIGRELLKKDSLAFVGILYGN